jgi:putative transposase
MRPPAANRAAQARRFASFARDFNEERPHEALGQRTPASVYGRSPRSMPARLPEPDYSSAAVLRQVRSNGEIKWAGDFVHICSALAGETIAVEETEDGHWRVQFFDVPIAIIDRDTRKPRRYRQSAVNGTGS